MRFKTVAAIAVGLLAGTTFALADATKEDAIAMVKKTVAAIKAEGTTKIYDEINTPNGKFQSGEIYIVVQGFDGMTLAHATNPKLIGKNMYGAQDVDGKFFAKDMADLGRTGHDPFWYSYKFTNPATKKIQVKDMYCEILPPTTVCAGVYRP